MSWYSYIERKFALSLVWQKHEYRSFWLSLFFIGIAASASTPLITLFLIKDLHVNPSFSGLFFLTALLGPVVSIFIGKFSDHIRSRLSLIKISIIWLAVGWGMMALAFQFWLAVGIGIVFFCVTSTLSAQIFAALREVMTRDTERYESTVSSTIRTAYSLGWILGPVVGSWLATAIGLRATFLLTSCFYLVSLLPLRSLNIDFHERSRTTASKTPIREHLPLLCFALVSMFVLSGDTLKSAYLPLYIVEGLKQNIVVFGSLLSVSAIVELVVIPLAGILADRVGSGMVIVGGVAIGVADYTLLASSTHVWQLYIVQILHVGVIAVLLGLGVTYAQQLSPRQPGLVSSIFFGLQGLSAPLGGVIGSYGVNVLGIPHVFFIPAVICALSLGILLTIRGAPENLNERDPELAENPV